MSAVARATAGPAVAFGIAKIDTTANSLALCTCESRRGIAGQCAFEIF